MKHHRNVLYEQTKLIYLLNAALEESVTLVMHLLYGKNLWPLYLLKQLLIKSPSRVPGTHFRINKSVRTKKSFFTHTDRINTIFKMQMCVTSKVSQSIHKKYLLYTNCRFIDLAFIISLNDKLYFQLTVS